MSPDQSDTLRGNLVPFSTPRAKARALISQVLFSNCDVREALSALCTGDNLIISARCQMFSVTVFYDSQLGLGLTSVDADRIRVACLRPVHVFCGEKRSVEKRRSRFTVGTAR